MNDREIQFSDMKDLRKRAERAYLDKAARAPEYEAPLTPQVARRILHELRVHQIELEMQNEELRLAYSELDAARSGYRDLYDLAPVGYLDLDEKGLITQANLTAGVLLGTPKGELFQQAISNFIFRDDQDVLYFFRKGTAENPGLRDCELRMERSDGSVFWALLQAVATRDADGVAHLRLVVNDISERKLAEEHIRKLANFDPLTGLPNRAHFAQRAHDAINLAHRTQAQLALMFVDLDHFKDINDTLGHSIGDALLAAFSSRLISVLRETDIVARVGGDEFIFLFYGVDAPGATQAAQRLLDVITTPIRIEQHDLNLTASIGIAMYPDDGTDLETLLKRAVAAMYHVKQEGRHGFCFFAAKMQALSARHLQIVNALHLALEHEQLTVHYQPQISMCGEHLIGAEALLRWTHPELGVVTPTEFIPAAEGSGLILPIGEWVLQQAVRQAKAWMEAGLIPFKIAVNLSAVQFRHADLPALVTRILETEGLSSENLELELTEGAALHDPQGAIGVMNCLHELGVRMSIDDFGTGFSSLGHLKKFKVYKLKIDQSFVHDISIDSEDRAIVLAIISLAKSLGLRTIAEGVDTKDQLKFLRANGCDEAQGYYYSKPLPADQFMEFARNKSWLPGHHSKSG